MKNILGFVVFLCTSSVFAQTFSLRSDERKLLEKATFSVYNVDTLAFKAIIPQLHQHLPDHPVVPLLQALQLFWKNAPYKASDPTFRQFIQYLEKSKSLATKLLAQRPTDELLFYTALSSGGLLAEFYAENGDTWKSVQEANTVYQMIAKSCEWATKNAEFAMPCGLYQYFREVYPEQNPVYKSFMWMFQPGNKANGLALLDFSCRNSLFAQPMAVMYTAYIFLRYEENPEKALEYLKLVSEKYPQNMYLLSKVGECYLQSQQWSQIEAISKKLKASSRYYDQMAGHIFWGLYLDHENKPDEAKEHLKKGIKMGDAIKTGGFYKCLAYIALADRTGPSEEREYYILKAGENVQNQWQEKKVEALKNQ